MENKTTKYALRLGAVLVVGIVLGAFIHKLVLCMIIGIIIAGIAIMLSKINAKSQDSD